MYTTTLCFNVTLRFCTLEVLGRWLHSWYNTWTGRGRCHCGIL